MSTIIESIEKEQLRRVPRFQAGDRVRVHFRVIEGSRTRTQVFEGVVLKRQGSGARETFTVRKQSFGVGVERTFPVHSPKIEQLEVAARGDVRRAKLYYLRDRVGKAARVAERRWGIGEDVLATEEEAPVDSEGTPQDEAEVEVTELEEETGEAGAAEAAEGADGAETETSEAEPDPATEPAASEPEPEADTEPEPNESTEPEASETEDDPGKGRAEEGTGEAAEEEAGGAEAEGEAGGEAESENQAGGSEEDSAEDEASERDG